MAAKCLPTEYLVYRSTPDQSVALPTGLGGSRQLERLQFTRFGAAAEIMLYNAVLIWLLALLWKLEPFHAGEIVERCATDAMLYVTGGDIDIEMVSVDATTTTPLLSMRFDPLRKPGAAVGICDPAMEICRAFEWQSENHASTANSEQNWLYLFPVGGSNERPRRGARG